MKKIKIQNMNKLHIIFTVISMALLNTILMGACTKEESNNEPSTTNTETTVSLIGTEWQRSTIDSISSGKDVVILLNNRIIKFINDDYGVFYQEIATFGNMTQDTVFQNHNDEFDYTFDGEQYGSIHMRNIQNISSITIDYDFEYSSDGKTLTLSANGKSGGYIRVE